MENYEQKYKEALEWIHSIYPTLQGAEKEDAERHFPELKESEDEKIRKEIISFMTDSLNWYPKKETKASWIAWLEKQGEPQDKGEISDGYHTFNELYYYRMLYNAAFFNMLPKEWVHKSKKHNDGEDCFGGGWFIVMANLPTGQISNHYELKNWDLFQIPEKEVSDKWDGHTPQEAADRLHKYLLEKQGEQKLLNNDKYQTVSVKILDRLYKSEKELERLKQGEQKPAYNENDENIMKAQLDYWRSVGGKEWYGVPVQETIAWLEKQIEQQPAWSEEDTDMIDHIIRCLKRCGGDMVAPKQPYQKEIDWLKSIKPQTHWKPSEEQMKALIIAVHNAHGHSYHKGIYLLLNDLKKL